VRPGAAATATPPADDTDDYRFVELKRNNGFGQGASGGGAIVEERWDRRDEAHAR
jgi:hypothetical protein